MSHKIKIDLCEVFGVEEGQEFYIDASGWKYKIENNNLFSFSCGNWAYSTLPVNVILDYTFKIEILKPETPPEIKKMLQAFYDLGFRKFYRTEQQTWKFLTVCLDEYAQTKLTWVNGFSDWASDMGLDDGFTYTIYDFIK